MKPLNIVSALLLIAIVAGAPSRANSNNFPRSGDLEKLDTIIDAAFRDNYQLAESLSIDLQRLYPYHPIGYVMQASMIHGGMLDQERFDREQDLYMLLELAESKSKAMLDTLETDAWAEYCLGLAHGSRAVFDARKGSWWSAVKRGIKAKRAFTRCIKSDSSFYDAYVGLGSYHYWRTVKTGAVNWLPFVQDDREEGLRELRVAADSSMFSRDFARDALIWVLIDMEEFENAEKLAEECSNRYPEGKKFLWGLGYARLELKDYIGARNAFLDLLSKLESEPNSNFYNLVECRYHLAQVQLETRQYAECKAQCEAALGYVLEESVHKRLKNRLSEISKMLEKCNEALEKLADEA